jgi:sterol desaturase/sphingolipid hydroxylase (fatty acid hydroxylase superfamily)
MDPAREVSPGHRLLQKTFHHRRRRRCLPAVSDYAYRPRESAPTPERYFRIGEGRVSGYLSCFLGVMSWLAVLCYRHPTLLTTPELRAAYDPAALRLVLAAGIWMALAFGALTFAIGRRRRLGAIGILFGCLAFALGGAGVEIGTVEQRRAFLGLDFLLLDLLVSAVLFIAIEKLVPRYREQAILRPLWRLDLAWFALNHLLIGAVLLLGNRLAPAAFGWATNDAVRELVAGLPVAAQVVLLLLCADFVQYWVHRAFHQVPLLWRIHAVHHSVETMDWLAGSRIHPVEVLVLRPLVMVPLYLLGATQTALDAYVILAAIQAVLVHANFGLAFGPLRYVFVTPQYHHWHHSREDPAIDTNYSVHTPLWDWLFRSLHLPGPHWPAEYGTVEEMPPTMLGQLLHPFRRNRHDEVGQSRRRF